MTDTMEAGLGVTEGFEIPEDARPKEQIPYEIKAEARREDSVLALTVEVPFDEYAKRLATTLKELKKNVAVPGFRKGKAPDAMLRKRFGKEIQEDAVRDIAPTVFNSYVLDKGVKLAAEAQIEDFHAEEGKPLVIDFVAEVMPDVVLNDYKGLSVEAEFGEPEGDLAEVELARIKQMFATTEVVEGGVLEAGSAATLDIHVADERGKTITDMTVTGYEVRSLSDAMPSEAVEALAGRRAEETVEVVVPRERKGAHGNVISSKDTYRITVKAVKRVAEPTIDDAWIKENLQIEGGLAEHRRMVEERAALEREEGKKAVALGTLLRAIHEKNPFDVPRTFVRRRFDQLLNEEMYRFARIYGRNAARSILGNQQFQHSVLERARREVINAFLILELSRKEGLEVGDAAVDAEIARRAEASGRKPLAVRAELERHQRLDDLKEELMRTEVEKFLLANNTVTYVAPKPHVHDHDAHDHDHEHGPDCGPDCGHDH